MEPEVLLQDKWKYVLSGWDKENEQNLAAYIFHIDSYLSEMAKGQKSEEKQL